MEIGAADIRSSEVDGNSVDVAVGAAGFRFGSAVFGQESGAEGVADRVNPIGGLGIAESVFDAAGLAQLG